MYIYIYIYIHTYMASGGLEIKFLDPQPTT